MPSILPNSNAHSVNSVQLPCYIDYVPLAGICDYKPKDQAKCCLAFGQNGECSQCQTGLFLDAGACKQSFLVGCISKVANKCINCASDFYLKDGLCVPGVEMCSAYADNGACRDCKQGFFLHRGACVQKRLLAAISNNLTDVLSAIHPSLTMVESVRWLAALALQTMAAQHA